MVKTLAAIAIVGTSIAGANAFVAPTVSLRQSASTLSNMKMCSASDVMARVRAMEQASGGGSRYSAPAPTPSYSARAAGSRESAADILARVATMGGGSAPTTAARPTAIPNYSAPAAGGRESAASILARVATMGGGSAPTTAARPAAIPNYSAPAPGGRESAASILARVATMGGGSAPTTAARPAAAAPSYSAPAPAAVRESASDILARVHAMSR